LKLLQEIKDDKIPWKNNRNFTRKRRKSF
jgi:hypothetical protein